MDRVIVENTKTISPTRYDLRLVQNKLMTALEV